MQFWRASEIARWTWRALAYSAAPRPRARATTCATPGPVGRREFPPGCCGAGFPIWLRCGGRTFRATAAACRCSMRRSCDGCRGAIWSSAYAVVAVSEPLRKLALETDSSVAIEVIPNGVNVDLFNPGSRADPFCVLFVGRLIERKGVADLVRAFGALAAAHPEARLVIAGSGPERDVPRTLAGQVVPPGRVDFIGQGGSGEAPGRVRFGRGLRDPVPLRRNAQRPARGHGLGPADRVHTGSGVRRDRRQRPVRGAGAARGDPQRPRALSRRSGAVRRPPPALSAARGVHELELAGRLVPRGLRAAARVDRSVPAHARRGAAAVSTQRCAACTRRAARSAAGAHGAMARRYRPSASSASRGAGPPTRVMTRGPPPRTRRAAAASAAPRQGLGAAATPVASRRTPAASTVRATSAPVATTQRPEPDATAMPAKTAFTTRLAAATAGLPARARRPPRAAPRGRGGRRSRR